MVAAPARSQMPTTVRAVNVSAPWPVLDYLGMSLLIMLPL